MKINAFSKLITELRALSQLPLTDTNDERNYAPKFHKTHLKDKRIPVKNQNPPPVKHLRHS